MLGLVFEHIKGTQSHIEWTQDENVIQVGQKHTF
jgi:hypothetical protein